MQFLYLLLILFALFLPSTSHLIMRTLVIGDIHGGLRALHQIFERANISTTDRLRIFLGDYVDGWSQSPQVIDFLIALRQTHSCVFIRGNHDELLSEWLSESKDNLTWYQHGGESTVLAYSQLSDATKTRHIAFFAIAKIIFLMIKTDCLFTLVLLIWMALISNIFLNFSTGNALYGKQR